MTFNDQLKYIGQKLDKPVVFIGMMGAGKTSVAKKCAEILDLAFIDSDLEIEKDEHISVKDIFESRGEPYFRELEKNKIASLLESGACILSVGGGSVTSPQTLENILTRALCVWLDAPVAVLARRTSSQGNRPLLNGRNVEEALAERMGQREHLYCQAHLRIDASGSILDVTHNAIGQIYNYLVKQNT